MTALVIHSYQGADETFARHFPYYCKAGADIFGVGRVDKPSVWPIGLKHFDIGNDAKHHPSNLVERFVETFRFCLENNMLAQYTDFCVIEYDTLFFKPLPKHPGGLVATLAGYSIPGAYASRFYHCPWWPDRKTAQIIVEEGTKLLKAGIYELGSPDLFLGFICDRRKINPSSIPWYSRNTVEPGSQMEEARRAYKEGVIGIHGIKNQKQIDDLMA